MKHRKLLSVLTGVAGAGLLAAALLPGAANAATPSALAGGCTLQLGSITAGGDHKIQQISSAPVAASPAVAGPKDLFPDGQARLAGSLAHKDFTGGIVDRTQYLVMGTSMYLTTYRTTKGQLTEPLWKLKIGGGWYQGGPRYFEDSFYTGSPTGNAYTLYGDNLERWTISGGGWSGMRFWPGFQNVKTMALISQTATYDTFLANMTGGSLYTVRVPKSGGSPVVKQVRASTWSGFETLVAEKCGSQSTLLLGIDKDTKSGYLYAVSHANGSSTVIKGLGKVPTTFDDPTYFRYRAQGTNLFGE